MKHQVLELLQWRESARKKLMLQEGLTHKECKRTFWLRTDRSFEKS